MRHNGQKKGKTEIWQRKLVQGSAYNRIEYNSVFLL